MKIKFFCILLLIGKWVSGQMTDTISVYFEFGKHILSDAELKEVRNIAFGIQLDKVDSIYFIGMADSVGSNKANRKLSQKRAREVARLFYPYFDPKPKARIFNEGEIQKDDPAINRRVDVIFFLHEELLETKLDHDVLPLCWKRADSLLHRSAISEVVFRKKEYVLIETNFAVGKTEFYCATHYATGGDKADSLTIYPIKWGKGRKSAGKSYVSSRYARIPIEDFKKFGVFKADTGCNDCSFRLNEYRINANETEITCWQVDRFLMQNIETKASAFSSSRSKVRASRDLVNLKHTYYAGCEYNIPLQWRPTKSPRKWNRLNKEKKRKIGKKRFAKRMAKIKASPYYYTELSNANKCMKRIVRKMTCCSGNQEPSECGECDYYPWCNNHWTECHTHWYKGIPLKTEVGYKYLANAPFGFLNAGTEKSYLVNNQFILTPSIGVGLTQQAKPIFDLGLRYTYFALPIYAKSDRGWNSFNRSYYPKTRIYFSLNYNASYLHIGDLGMRWNNALLSEIEWYGGFNIPRSSVYINGGVGLGPKSNGTMAFSPQLQFGIRSRFFR